MIEYDHYRIFFFIMQITPKIDPQKLYRNRNELGIQSTINLLKNLIENDSNLEKRKNAVKYLGLIKDQSCFETFENLLISDRELKIKCEAAKALGRLKVIKGLKPLKWMLNNDFIDNELKKHILRAIEKIRFDDPEIKLFIEHLNCSNKSIKTCIKNRLINLGPSKLLNILLESLQTENISIKYGKTLLKLMGYKLFTMKLSEFTDFNLKFNRPKFAKNLIENKEFIVELLTSIFTEDDEQLLDSTILILKLLGPEVENLLINFLYNEEIVIKKNAILLIGKLKIKETIDLLILNLSSDDEEISIAAIQALGEMEESRVIPKLLIVLDIETNHINEFDQDRMRFIIDAVNNIYQASLNPNYQYLFYALRFDNPLLKQCVISIMGKLKEKVFVKILNELLKKEINIETLQSIIWALGNIGSVEALDQLLNLFEKEESPWFLKLTIFDAIRKIFNEIILNKNDIQIRANNNHYLNSICERISEYLYQEKEENYKVKLAIIKFLENFGTRTSIRALLKQLRDFYGIIRIYASRAIKAIDKRTLEN